MSSRSLLEEVCFFWHQSFFTMFKENWWIEYKRFVKCFSRNIVDQNAIFCMIIQHIYIYCIYIYKCNMNILLSIYRHDVDISSRKLWWELPSWELSNQKLSHDKILGLWRSFLVQIRKVFAGCQMKKDEPGIQHFIVFRHIRWVFHLMPTTNANSVSGAWRYSYFKLVRKAANFWAWQIFSRTNMCQVSKLLKKSWPFWRNACCLHIYFWKTSHPTTARYACSKFVFVAR